MAHPASGQHYHPAVALRSDAPRLVAGQYALALSAGDQRTGGPASGATADSPRFLFTTPARAEGLEVIASVIYSLPFAVQPIQNAFVAIGPRPLEVAATLGASPWDRFISVALPLAKPGLITGAVLGFAHTLGEFGVVLMIGGNIPGQTQVLSVAIFDHVEAYEYAAAHVLAAGMLGFSFIVLLTLYWRTSQRPLQRV